MRQRGRDGQVVSQRLSDAGTKILAVEVPSGDLADGAVAEGVEDGGPALHAQLVVTELTLRHRGIEAQSVSNGFWPLRSGDNLSVAFSILVVATDLVI